MILIYFRANERYVLGKCFIRYKLGFLSNANKVDCYSLHTKINVDLYVFGKATIYIKLERCLCSTLCMKL